MQNKVSLAWRDQKTAVIEAPLKIGDRKGFSAQLSEEPWFGREAREEHQRLLGDARRLRTLGLVITHKTVWGLCVHTQPR